MDMSCADRSEEFDEMACARGGDDVLRVEFLPVELDDERESQCAVSDDWESALYGASAPF